MSGKKILEVDLTHMGRNDEMRSLFQKNIFNGNDTSEVIFYMQLDDIKLSLDSQRRSSSDVIRLLEDAQLFLNHTDCKYHHMTTLYEFCVNIGNPELLIMLIKHGFSINETNCHHSLSSFINKDVIDVLMEYYHGPIERHFSIVLAYSNKVDVLTYAYEKNYFDLDYFLEYPAVIFYTLNDDCLRFVLGKIIETVDNFDINMLIESNLDILLHADMLVIKLLIREYNLNTDQFADNFIKRSILWHHRKYVEFIFPYIVDHFTPSSKYSVMCYSHPIAFLKTCATLLISGMDFTRLKEILDSIYPEDDYDTNNISQYRSTKTQLTDDRIQKICTTKIKRKLLEFWEENIRTNRISGDDLYDSSMTIIDGVYSYGVYSEEIFQIDDLHEWLHRYFVCHSWIGIHLIVGEHHIPFIEKICKYYVCVKLSKFFDCVSKFLNYEEFDQSVKDALLMICFMYPTEICKNDITEIEKDHTDTIMLLLENGADISKVVNRDKVPFDLTRGKESLVDTILESGVSVEHMFLNAVTYQYTNIIVSLLQKYPSEINFDLIQKSDFIRNHDITQLLLEHLTNICFPEETNTIVNKLITKSILVSLMKNVGLKVRIKTPKTSVEKYTYLLEKGLDCRIHDDFLVLNVTRYYDAMILIHESLSFRLRSDPKTVCHDLITIVKNINKDCEKSAYLNRFDKIVRDILQARVYDGHPDLLLELISEYQNNTQWYCLTTQKYYIELKTKYAVDKMLDDYARETLGMNYSEEHGKYIIIN